MFLLSAGRLRGAERSARAFALQVLHAVGLRAQRDMDEMRIGADDKQRARNDDCKRRPAPFDALGSGVRAGTHRAASPSVPT
jgi:hypothetical protein